MKDAALKQSILDELAFEPRVDPSNIGVTVEDGVAAIFGHVKSFSQRMAAEDAARRVMGVRAIANEVDVNLPGNPHTNDEDIALRAVRIFEWDPVLRDDPIEIRVQNGQIELSGEVDSLAQKDRAEQLVGSLDGLRGVFNHLRVTPPTSGHDLQPRIEAALQRHAALEARGIKISVTAGDVTISGCVDSLSEKRLVEQTVGGAPGVKSITNNLSIGG